MNNAANAYQAISNGQGLPQQIVLQFADATDFIQGVDVYNASTLAVILQFNGQTITVPAYRREVLNIPPTKTITVSYLGQATTDGFVHIYYSDVTQVPASYNLGDSVREGVIASTSQVVSVPGGSTGFATETLFSALVGNAPSAVPQIGSSTANTITRRIALVHLTVQNFPAADGAEWQLVPNGPGSIEEYNVYTNSAANFDSDFSYPYPLYDVHGDPIGSTIQIGLYVINTPSGGPFSVPVTAQFLLT